MWIATVEVSTEPFFERNKVLIGRWKQKPKKSVFYDLVYDFFNTPLEARDYDKMPYSFANPKLEEL